MVGCEERLYACQGHPGEGMRFRSIQAKVAVLSLVQLGISSLFAGIAHSYPTDCNELRELYWKKKNLALDYRIEEVQLLKLIRYETTKKDQDLQCTRMEELGLGREEWARRLSSCKSVYDALAVLNDKMDGLYGRIDRAEREVTELGTRLGTYGCEFGKNPVPRADQAGSTATSPHETTPASSTATDPADPLGTSDSASTEEDPAADVGSSSSADGAMPDPQRTSNEAAAAEAEAERARAEAEQARAEAESARAEAEGVAPTGDPCADAHGPAWKTKIGSDGAQSCVPASKQSADAYCQQKKGAGYRGGPVLPDGSLVCVPDQVTANAWCVQNNTSGYRAVNISPDDGAFICKPNKATANAWCKENNGFGWYATSVNAEGGFDCYPGKSVRNSQCRRENGRRSWAGKPVRKGDSWTWSCHIPGTRTTGRPGAGNPAAEAVIKGVIDSIIRSQGGGSRTPPRNCHRGPNGWHCGSG